MEKYSFVITTDIQHRIKLASAGAAFGRLSQRVFFNRNLSLTPITKIAVYNAVSVYPSFYMAAKSRSYTGITSKL